MYNLTWDNKCISNPWGMNGQYNQGYWDKCWSQWGENFLTAHSITKTTQNKYTLPYILPKRGWGWRSGEWQINERSIYEKQKIKILTNINLRENWAKRRSLKWDNKYKSYRKQTDKFDYIKIKTSCASKDTINKWKDKYSQS